MTTTTKRAWDFSDLKIKTLPPVYGDRSTLENYANCPYMADAIAKGKVKDTGHLGLVGTEGHKILADAMESRGDDYRDVADWIEQELPGARPDLQPEVIQSMKGVAETLRHIAPERIIDIEKQYSTQFLKQTRKRGAVILTCCMDLLLAGKNNTFLHVHDYKTGWKRLSNSAAHNAFQTCFYSWILWKELPELQAIHFWYEQTRFGTRSYAKLERERDFYNFEGRIQSAVDLWLSESNEAWPDPDKCAWCPATALCPHVTDEAGDINKDTPGYLGRFIAMEARLKAIKKAMKSYVDKHGPIKHNGMVYGWAGVKKIAYTLHKDKDDDNGEE